ATTGPASSNSRRAEKRRVEASPPRQGQPAEKRSRVVEEPSASEPQAAVPRPDGKRKAVTIHRGVSSSEGAGSLRPPKKTVKKVADLEFVPLWLLSKDACRRAAEKETGFKKPMIQNSDGTFVEADEACPDGYVQEGDLDWILWNECTKMHAPTSVGTVRSRRCADERGTDECSADERAADERRAVEAIAMSGVTSTWVRPTSHEQRASGGMH
ncbi:unnamed protein product, partial [Tilletia caries]